MPRTRAALPLIVMEISCNESWAAMQGNRRRRHCRRCNKHVNNVSSLTSHELASILATAEPVCLRVMHEADGTPIAADTPRWRRLKLSLRRAAAGFAAMLVAHPIAGCVGRDDGATVGHVMNRNLQSSLAASSMDRESQAQMAASLRKQIEQSAEAID